MKKILFLLVLIYSYSFSINITRAQFIGLLANNSLKVVSSESGTYTTNSVLNSGRNYAYNGNIYNMGWYSSTVNNPSGYPLYKYTGGVIYYELVPKSGGCLPTTDINGNVFICDSDGVHQYVPNPDPLGEPACRDIFQSNGQAYTCNPNTNEATPIPNSNGTTTDPEDGQTIPSCNDGYTATNSFTLTSGGSGSGFTTWTCSKNVTNPDGSVTGDNGVTVYPDGSIEKPNPDGSKTRVYMDGSTATTHSDGTVTTTPPTTPPDTTTPPTTGTGGTTGGTSGTGSTGGTTGTDTGSGSTGGTSGSTDTGGTTGGTSGTGSTGGTTGTDTGTGTTGGTGSTGGVGSTETTGGTGGTTGTDSGSTGGTSGGGSGGTSTTPPTTEPTTGTGNCNDSGLTLEQKELCRANTNLNSIDTSLGSIKDFLTPNGTLGNENHLGSSGGLIDGVIGEYSTLKTNLTTQKETLEALVYGSIDTVNQGFNFNISSNEVLNCPKNYTLDMSALNMANMDVTLDICEQTSKLKPYFYPLFLILFSITTTIITFRMIGVLL